jgi:hypothetical protein
LRSEKFTIKVFVDTDDIYLTDGEFDPLNESRIIREEVDGNLADISRIEIDLLCATNEERSELISVNAQVKLLQGDIKVPIKRNWLQINVLGNDVVSSVDLASWALMN